MDEVDSQPAAAEDLDDDGTKGENAKVENAKEENANHFFQRIINFINPGFRILGGTWTAKFRNDESGATASHEISADMTGKELLTTAGFDSTSLSISLVGRSGVKSIDKDKKLVD